ncbi:MAG: response regulator [Desulfatitalea sp.]|nr:response regulator [Desulfatitalea sp.]NNK02288.1 response regulator [Desulfatitalea sp.]
MPAYAWQADPLTFWRERILFLMCTICVGMGFFALIASLVLSYKEGFWAVMAVDVTAYLAMVCALVLRSLPLKVRGGIAFACLYSLGVGLSFLLGPVGAGYIWLFGASIMAGAIIGMGASIASLALNLFTLAGVGLYIFYAPPFWAVNAENVLERWLVMALNFLLLNSFVTISTAFMLNGLKQALTKEQEISADLRQSEERYRIVADFNYDWEYWLGPQGELHYVSPSCQRITGYTADEFMANPDLLATIVHEKDMDRTSNHLSADTRENPDVDFMDFRIVRSDQQIKWISHFCLPVYSDNGNYLGRRASNRDITDRKVIEDKLSLHHERFLTVLNSIDASIYVADLDTYEILFMNKHMIETYGEDMTGGRCYEALRDESEPCDWCNNYELINEHMEPSGVHIWQEQNPVTSKWYVNHDRAIRWTDGRLAKIQIATDITELKKLENELRQSHKMEAIGTLAGGIAHDFNNILASIIGFTELALDDAQKGTLLEDNLQQVYIAGNRAKELVKQILTFARQSDEKTKPLQVNTIAKEVLKLIRSSIPSSIRIQQDTASTALIMGNPAQMHQVLMNLCTNAAQAMEHSGGTLGVYLEDINVTADNAHEHENLDQGEYLLLSVSDTGDGMDPRIMDSIFEPFFTTKGPGEGTGMGLAMVHGIVESCGGKIVVNSKLGQGSVFKLYFPAFHRRSEANPSQEEMLPSGNERILLVDDELPITTMSGQLLEKLGYRVTTRTSSVEALSLFQSKPYHFDLIITDMTMPNISGDRLAAEMMRVRPDLPVILCTGYSKVISDEMAKEMGIKAFIYKPIVKNELAKIIRQVLDESAQAA